MGSSLVTGHSSLHLRADVAQLVEHVLGKDGVSGSIPLIGSRNPENELGWTMKMGSQDQMEAPQFQVEVSDYSVSVNEWRRAQNAPKDELPPLSEAQRDVANKFGISEEEYARSVLAGRYGVRRLRTRARKLGEEIEKILLEFSAECRVVRVVADMARERWVILIQTPTRQIGMTVPREIGDDFLDFMTSEAIEELNARVKSSLRLGEKGISPR